LQRASVNSLISFLENGSQHEAFAQPDFGEAIAFTKDGERPGNEEQQETTAPRRGDV